MTRMNYSTNRSRNMSNQRYYYGDEAVYVRCVICTASAPADGHGAIRVQLARGVKARIGYRGPAQTWLCRDCADAYGRNITVDQVEALFPIAAVDEPLPSDVPDASDGPRFWKWALAAGAAALIGWTFFG